MSPVASRGTAIKNTLVGSLSVLWVALAALPVAAQNQTWIRQFGTDAQDCGTAVAPDGVGGVYVGGWMRFLWAGGGNAWLAHYDGAGIQTWLLEHWSNGGGRVASMVPDGAGGVYVCGGTYGSLGGPNLGFEDAWIARYDSVGHRSWIRQFGTNGQDVASAVSLDNSGGVYVGGSTGGNLGGPSAGLDDAWLARYDNSGSRTWIRQFGTSAPDKLAAAAPDGSGGAYIGGLTGGALGGPSAGNNDVWLARYDSGGNRTWTARPVRRRTAACRRPPAPAARARAPAAGSRSA